MKSDVLIIGAGPMGLSAARELSGRDCRVLILDRNPGNVQPFSENCAEPAVVRAGLEEAPGSLRADMITMGARIFPVLARSLGLSFEPRTALVMGVGGSDRAVMRVLLERGRKNGLGELSFFSGDEARGLDSMIPEEVTSVLVCPGYGLVDYTALCAALEADAGKRGAELHRNLKVTDIKKERGGYVVKCADGSFYETAMVINAAGREAERIHHMISGTELNLSEGDTAEDEILLGEEPERTEKNLLYRCGTGTCGKGSESEDGDSPSGEMILRECEDRPGFFDAAGLRPEDLAAIPAAGIYIAERVRLRMISL